MKLELKHLSAYLPYKVKVSKMHNLNARNGIGGIEHMLSTKNSQYKLHLRPLSDLTKDKKFNDLYFYFYDKDEGIMVKRKNENYTRLNELSYLFENHYDVFGLIDNGLAIDINTLKV
jgi:hypothetical protein